MIRLHKRTLLAGVAALALLPWTVTVAAAQDDQQNDRPPQAQQQRKRMQKLFQALNLTADQKKQWQQINRETNQKIWATRKDDSLNEAQMQAQIREIHRQHNQQLLAILSPGQQESLQQFWEEQKQKQQDKTAGSNNSSSGQTAQADNNSKTKEDDDLFAGMVSDDPAPAQPQQNKKGPK
jgi:hypothetical protein